MSGIGTAGGLGDAENGFITTVGVGCHEPVFSDFRVVDADVGMRWPSGEKLMSVSISRTTVLGTPPSTGARYRSKEVPWALTAFSK
jgi:hypothetical protein